jgi:hypothetical protein
MKTDMPSFIYTTKTVRCVGKAVKIKTDEELNYEISK